MDFDIDNHTPEQAVAFLKALAMATPSGGTVQQAAQIAQAIESAASTLAHELHKSPKTKNNMPDTFNAEVWDHSNENLIQGFTGEDALCEAIESTNNVPSTERNIYYLNGSTWLQWIGPRPTNPPGR